MSAGCLCACFSSIRRCRCVLLQLGQEPRAVSDGRVGQHHGGRLCEQQRGAGRPRPAHPGRHGALPSVRAAVRAGVHGVAARMDGFVHSGCGAERCARRIGGRGFWHGGRAGRHSAALRHRYQPAAQVLHQQSGRAGHDRRRQVRAAINLRDSHSHAQLRLAAFPRQHGRGAGQRADHQEQRVGSDQRPCQLHAVHDAAGVQTRDLRHQLGGGRSHTAIPVQRIGHRGRAAVVAGHIWNHATRQCAHHQTAHNNALHSSSVGALEANMGCG